MNYQTLYNSIINNRTTNRYNGYTEKHHIIPRSLGGTNEQDNLVGLTAREHFICHYLLAKMYPKESVEWYKMNHAFMMMKCYSMNNERYFNSRLYEALKLNFSSAMSKSQTGTSNSQYGTMWICNIQSKENKKIPTSNPLPEGWVKGRNKWNTQQRCVTCGSIFTHPWQRKYCSDMCIPTRKSRGSQLDGREEEFLLLYKDNNSINKSLKLMGFVGAGEYYYWAKQLLS